MSSGHSDSEPHHSLALIAKLTSYTRTRVSDQDAEDIASEALFRAYKACQNSGKPFPPSYTYLQMSSRSLIADRIRENIRRNRQAETDISEHTDYLEALGRQVTSDSLLEQILELRFGKNESWKGIESTLVQSETNLRKRWSRATRAAKASLVLQWFTQERFKEINRYRLPVRLMFDVANKARQASIGPDCFQAAFRNSDWHLAIHNATWVLMALAHYHDAVVSFLIRQLGNQELFRGNRNYIAECLMALDPVHHAVPFREHFLSSLPDMKSRVEREEVKGYRDQAPVQSVSLLDVFNYKPVKMNMDDSDVEELQRLLLRGQDDVDLHRTLTWQLMSTGSREDGGLKTAIGILSDEEDQTNVYYIFKFIMKLGLRYFRQSTLNRETLKRMRLAAQRWPQNLYLGESAARFSRKLHPQVFPI